MRINKKNLLLIVLFLTFASLHAQLSDSQKLLRIKIWAPLDENPATQIIPQEDEPFYGTSIRSLKVVAPYLLSGMIYGWKFEYTPSDKTRNVEEYFSFEPIAKISEEDRKELLECVERRFNYCCPAVLHPGKEAVEKLVSLIKKA